MSELQTIWYDLNTHYTGRSEMVEQLWNEIEKNYTHPQRCYHNLAHLQYMLDLAFAYRDRLSDPDTLLYSVFYHDLIYTPTRRDNEQRSADTARNRLHQLGIPNDKIARCHQQILATRDHQHHAESDTRYLLDFDLSILRENPETYRDYTRKIRREYSIYPDFLYRKGRKKVIHNFLDRDRIFSTDEFYSRYEQAARENLQAELQGL